MKTVRVVAAVIKAINKNGESIIFATQRGYGDFQGVGERHPQYPLQGKKNVERKIVKS